MSHRHARAARAIDRLFTDARPLGQALLQEIRACPRCRARYRRHALLEARLCGGQPLGPFALERIQGRLFAELEAAPAPRPGAAAAAVGAWRWGLGTLGGAAAALALVLLVLWPRPGDDRLALGPDAALRPLRFSARGVSLTGEAQVGVRAFTLTAERALAGEPATPRIDGALAFSYTNAHPEVGYLALLGLQPEGEVRWYLPGYGARTSIALEHDVVDRALDFAIRLSVNHRPGPLYLVALFSAAPLDVAAIEQAVAALGDRRRFIEARGRLSLPGHQVLQQGLLTEILPEEP